jgi:predicted Zn-ribbon and HTH transcriptional regulator
MSQSAAYLLRAEGWTVIPPGTRRRFRCRACRYEWLSRVYAPHRCPRCGRAQTEPIP